MSSPTPPTPPDQPPITDGDPLQTPPGPDPGSGGFPPPEAPTVPLGPPPRRLVRPRGDRAIAGVSSGIARHLGLDPVLVRIVMVALAVAGGAGFLIYLAGWILIPSEDAVDGVPGGAARGGPTAATIAGSALLVIGLAVLLPGPGFWFGGGVVFLLAVAGAAVWFLMGSEGRGHSTARRAALAFAVLCSCVGLAVAGAVTGTFGSATLAASLVIATGVVLVGSAFFGGAKWLIPLGLAFALPLSAATAMDLDFEGGVGERYYRALGPDDLRPSYELGAGEFRLDLRDYVADGPRQRVSVRIGMGDLRILTDQDSPSAPCIEVDAEAGLGHLDIFGAEYPGADVHAVERSVPCENGAPDIVFDLEVGLGEIRVGDGTLFDSDFDFDRPDRP